MLFATVLCICFFGTLSNAGVENDFSIIFDQSTTIVDSNSELEQIKARSLNLKIDDIPIIRQSQLSSFKIIKRYELNLKRPKIDTFIGFGHFYLATAQLNDQKVFIKFPNGAQVEILTQLQLTDLLSNLQIGPKFHGIYYDQQGNPGIMTDFVDGIDFTSHTTEIPPQVKVSLKTLHDLISIETRLKAVGLIHGSDFQTRMSLSGDVYIVDPDFLRFSLTGTNEIEAQIARMKLFLQKLLGQ